MAQYEMNLRDYWLIIRRRKSVVILCTLAVMGLAYVFALRRIPVYEATSAVKFEQSTSLSGLLVEVLSYSTADSIETQASLIKSFPILEEVARRLGKLPDTARGEPLRESRAYTATLDSIAARIRTARVANTSILEITATSTNPREARDLANTVADTYRDYNRSVRNLRITEARKFIESQLRDVEARVKRAEEEIWAFREANRIISPGAESSVLLSIFTQLRGDIEKTRQQRTELEVAQARLSRYDEASVADRVFVESANPGLQKLQATQVDLLMERNNLALEVTDKHPRLQALDERLREVRTEMRREISAQVALLRNREEILNRQMGEVLQKNREVPAVELGLQRLQRDAKVNGDLLTLLKTKHQEALIKESEGIEEVTIIRPATEPAAPVSSETFNTMFIGALLGLLVGLVLAFVQETLDTSIGTIEDVESYLQVPVLGIVPHINAQETLQRLIERRPALAQMDADALQSHALLITHFDPKSPVAEAYRTLRTNIQFMRLERQGKLLVVTSPTLQEGKTTTIVNLAITMAQNGQRTLLVGANLRRPSLHRFFGIEREPGLSDILVGNARWRDCIRTVADILMGRFEMEDVMASPGLDNLHIIESGPIPANPSELLSTRAMSQFLQEVRQEYDIVLIDTPPVLPVTDSAIVSAQADGVILVYQAGKVGRLVLKRAKAHLESARGKVWGVVLNDIQTEIAGYAYSQYYTHYYGEETPGDSSPGPVARLLGPVRAWLGRATTRRKAAPVVKAPARPAEPPPAAPPPAERPLAERPSAEVPSVEVPSVERPLVELSLAAPERAAPVSPRGPRSPAWSRTPWSLAWLRAPWRIVSIEQVQRKVSDFFSVTLSNLMARNRTTAGTSSRALLTRVVLGLLLVLLLALVAWQLGWLGRPLRPRDQLQRKLASPMESPSSRAASGEPSTPASGVPPFDAAPTLHAPSPAPSAAAVAQPPQPPPLAAAPAPADPAPTPEVEAPVVSAPLAPARPAPGTEAPVVSVSPAPARPAPRAEAPVVSVPPAPARPAPRAKAPVVSAPPAPARHAPGTEAPVVAARPVPARPAPPTGTPAVTTPRVPPGPAPARPAGAPIVAAKPAPARPAPPPASTVPAPAPSPGPTTVPPEPAARFSVEFGPFPNGAEADRIERQLSLAGHPTVRFRQQTGAAVYAVLIERVPSLGEAAALITALHDQGFAEAVILGTGPGPSVRVGEPMVLRGAVQLAERLRARGHHVRIAAHPGEAVIFVIRHGNFASREEAEDRSGELARLGLPNHVVRVR